MRVPGDPSNVVAMRQLPLIDSLIAVGTMANMGKFASATEGGGSDAKQAAKVDERHRIMDERQKNPTSGSDRQLLRPEPMPDLERGPMNKRDIRGL